MTPDSASIHVKAAGDFGTFLVATPFPFAQITLTTEDLYTQIAQWLSVNNFEVVSEKIFASLTHENEINAARRRALSSRDISAEHPVTYVEGTSTHGTGLSGVAIHAIPGGNGPDSPRTIFYGGAPQGRVWSRDDTTYLHLANLFHVTEEPEEQSGAEQIRAILHSAQAILKTHGATYRDVVRTWFYLERILDWYDEFNHARTDSYHSFDIMPEQNCPIRLPASTGIEGNNPMGGKAVLDLFAVCSQDNNTTEMMTNAGQEEAFNYGSAFSRATCINSKNSQLIRVSGTAAIDEYGETLHVDDLDNQIRCTFDKIEQLISTKGATLQDIVSATVFLKKPDFQNSYLKEIKKRQLTPFPAITVVADICRDDLLFEIDAEVFVSK